MVGRGVGSGVDENGLKTENVDNDGAIGEV